MTAQGSKWMPEIKWERTVSLGNLLSIATVLVAVIYGWTRMESEVGALRSANARLEAEFVKLNARADVLNTKMTDSERETVRVLTRVETTLAGLQMAITRLERLAERVDNQGGRQ